MRQKDVDIRDIILILIANSPDQRVEGRVLLQKLAYFISRTCSIVIPFEPHYYGPYSETLANGVSSLVALGFLEEKEERFDAGPNNVFEARKYTYTLSDAGRQIFDRVKSENISLFSDIEILMAKIAESGNCNYKCLSIAAKLDHILQSEGKPLRKEEVVEIATSLGWKIDIEEAENAADFLLYMGLIKIGRSPGQVA